MSLAIKIWHLQNNTDCSKECTQAKNLNKYISCVVYAEGEVRWMIKYALNLSTFSHLSYFCASNLFCLGILCAS